MTTRTLIVGSGALGLYYGGRLAVAGNPVVFLARGPNLDALNRDGLSVSSIRGDFTVPEIETAGDVSAALEKGPYDLMLLTLKAHQTEPSLLESLRPALASGGAVLTLQNGVESGAVVAAVFGDAATLVGIAFIGSERIAPGRVAHTAAGHIIFGELGGERSGGGSARVESLRALFESADIDARVSCDIRMEQWRKLVWNAPFNGMTALAVCYAHEIVADEEGCRVARGIMEEVVSVARGLGVSLDAAVVDETLDITRRAGPVRTSMLVDFEKGRMPEVGALYDPPIREGRRLGIATPRLETLRALLRLRAGNLR